jgi:hypothetical protein
MAATLLSLIRDSAGNQPYKVYVGDTFVKKIYCNDTLIFECRDSDLPEYLQTFYTGEIYAGELS